MVPNGPPPRDRHASIRALLSRLESAPPQDLDAVLKTRIAQAWRIIEASEPDADAPWTVSVLEPETGATLTVGVGYHDAHGFDLDRGGATLRYALHRAALRLSAEVPESDLYDTVHQVRAGLLVSDLDRTDPDEEQLWYTVLNPGPINGRPRLPKTPTVPGATEEDAILLARWRSHPRWRQGALAASEFAERLQEIHATWTVDDVRCVLPTVYELAAILRDLDLPVPDTAQGRRLQRMLAAVAANEPSPAPFFERSRVEA